MVIKFDLIAAACENMGIGKNRDLPWRLKSEMAFFTQMTKETTAPNRKNVVLMGRNTWDCIPANYKPLKDRINFVLSRSKLNLDQYEHTYAFTSFEEATSALESEQFKDSYENVWVIGGSHIYDEAMKSTHFHRLYLTKIKKAFDCDTFFPKYSDNLLEVIDKRVPQGVQEENNLQFVYHVLENPKFGKTP